MMSLLLNAGGRCQVSSFHNCINKWCDVHTQDYPPFWGGRIIARHCQDSLETRNATSDNMRLWECQACSAVLPVRGTSEQVSEQHVELYLEDTWIACCGCCVGMAGWNGGQGAGELYVWAE